MPMVDRSDCPFSQSRECRWFARRETEPTAFLIAPSDDNLADIRKFVMDVARERVDECRQAIEIPPSSQEIWCSSICRQIIAAQFVLIVFDESGWRRGNEKLPEKWTTRERNANVYLEYGLALGMKKRAVGLVSNGTDLPFDIGGLSVLYYDPAGIGSNPDSVIHEQLRNDLLKSIDVVYPRLTTEQAEEAVRCLRAFYLPPGPGRLPRVVDHAEEILVERGLAAWSQVSAAIRSYSTARPRIEAGVKKILSVAGPGGYPPRALPDYVAACVAEGSYSFVARMVANWPSARLHAFSPRDIPGLLAGSDASLDMIPCNDDWSFAEPAPPVRSDL